MSKQSWKWTPRSGFAEWNITYRCDLSCTSCCRFCYLPPTTDDMTIEDGQQFIDEANALNWKPEIWIIGGEPTLHPKMLEFVELASTFGTRVRLMSNQYRPEAKRLVAEADKIIKCSRPLCAKVNGSVDHFRRDYCIAPRDFGVTMRPPCHIHPAFRNGCGISVDHEGYCICSNGGAIDGIHELGLRTKRLADLFDPDIAAKQTEVLCGQYCGCEWKPPLDPTPVLRECHCVPASPTWQKAFTRLKDKTHGHSI